MITVNENKPVLVKKEQLKNNSAYIVKRSSFFGLPIDSVIMVIGDSIINLTHKGVERRFTLSKDDYLFEEINLSINVERL